MTITGNQVRDARETLGWSRQQVADYLRVFTVAKIARIETKGPRPDEEASLEALFRKVVGVAIAEMRHDKLGSPESPPDLELELPDPPASEGPQDDPDAQVVTTEWRGIKRGDIIRIDGEKQGARFRFGYHFKNPTQEYVAAYAVKNGGERCVRPERIRTSKNKIPS